MSHRQSMKKQAQYYMYLPGWRHPLVADGDDRYHMGSRFWPRSVHHQGKGRGEDAFLGAPQAIFW